MTGSLLLTFGVLTLLAPPVESHDNPTDASNNPVDVHQLGPVRGTIFHVGERRGEHPHAIAILDIFGGDLTGIHPKHFEIEWIRVYKNPAIMTLKELEKAGDATAGTATFVRGWNTGASYNKTNYVVTPPDFEYRRARLFSSLNAEHKDLDAGRTKLEDVKDEFFWVKIKPGTGPSDPTSGGLLKDPNKPGNSGRVTATENRQVVPGDRVAIAVNVKLRYYRANYDFIDPRTERVTSSRRSSPYLADMPVVDTERNNDLAENAQVRLPLFFRENQRGPDKDVVWANNVGFKLEKQGALWRFVNDIERQSRLNNLAGGAIIAAMHLPGVGILNPNYPLENAITTAEPILHGDIDRSLTHFNLKHPNAHGYHTLVYQFTVQDTAAHRRLNDLVEWLERSDRDGHVRPFNVPYEGGIDYAWATFYSTDLTAIRHEDKYGFWVPFFDANVDADSLDGRGGRAWHTFLDPTLFIEKAPYSLRYRHHDETGNDPARNAEGPAIYTKENLFDPNDDGILDFFLPLERWSITVPNPRYQNPILTPDEPMTITRDAERHENPQEIPRSAGHYLVRDRAVRLTDVAQTVVQPAGFYDADEQGQYFRHHLPPTYDGRQGVIHYPRLVAQPVAAMTEIDVPSGIQTGPFTLTLRFQEDYGPDGKTAAYHDVTSEELLLTLQTALSAGVGDRPVTVSRPDAADAWLRYQVTVVPALGFKGEMTFQVPADTVFAHTDLDASIGNVASAAVTVPVDTVQVVADAIKVVEPEGGAYLAGSEITVEVPFAQDGLTFEGENPPYVTIYLGAREAANARHATWQKGKERSGSTIVPFAYVLQASDPPAASVSVDIDSINSLSVPRETTLKAASGLERVGTADPAVAPGEAAPVPDTPSTPAKTFDVPVTPVIYLPQDDTVSKAVASTVPRSPVVFNELGNGSEAANDWLEFRNVSGSDVSLKDWELSVVADGKKEDTSLIVFPDVSVPANGLLLITNMPSDKTPLAGGENRGLSHASLVDAGLSLPDDGKFLLILRNAKEKLGLDEAFIDVAGGGGSDTDAFVRDETGDYDTYVWPLQVLEAPGDATEDALSAGKVWQRAKADIIGYHQAAWAEAAFTGIGYDRQVSQSAATAGTPGYPNGAAKTAASTPKGAVTISEIMFDSDRGKLPQWIELYNKSKTEALNLDRWQLEIQNRNSEDLIGRPIVTLTLQEKVIQPNQTLLIVAGDARASSADVFPEDRVYNLLKLHEKNLRIKTPRDTFLSGEGFYLKLSDRNGTKIDEVGNIDDNRRTDDAPVWVWPTNRREGPRSSVVRRYDKGTSDARDGMLKSNWALSANFNQFKVESLHYGHADDIGTPGYRKGGALPVELSSFKVTRTDEGPVVVTWTTESEVDNAGFNLRRSLTRDSGFTLLNPVLIAGAGTTGERQTYTFTDTSAKPGVEYYYQIEEVSLGGRPETLRTRRLPGPVSPANRALTTFGEVKQRE